MFEGMLSQPGAIGSTSVKGMDGSVIFMYSTNQGKIFKKSYDNGRTFEKQWTVSLGTITANSNLIRLKDQSLMMTLKKTPENDIARKMGGADFSVVFSQDEGETWGDEIRVNKNSGCYYLMNDRIVRLSTGRILLPLCWHPDDFLNKDYFEKMGYSGCFYSDDEGKSWSEGEWLTGENAEGMLAEPMVIETSDGRVLMYMRTGRGYLYMSESFDQGVTFSTERASSLRSPNAPFAVAKDEFSSKFFAVWDNSFPSHIHQYPRSPICIAQSDDGQKWDMICELDNNPDQNYGYPALTFSEDEIAVTYYFNNTRQFNNDINQIKIKIFKREELIAR